MRITKTAALLSPVLISFVSAALAQPAPVPTIDKNEPAADYVLMVNGNKLPLTLGNEVVSKVAGQQLHFKLSRQPFRQFEKSGVKFRYPASYGFEADDSQPNVMIWTMSGNSSLVMLQRFSPLPPAQISSDMIGEVTRQFGAKNVIVTPLNLVLKGHKVQGKKLNVAVGGQNLSQEIYAFTNKKNSFVLIIQDVPEKGKPSLENTKLKVLLTQSLKW